MVMAERKEIAVIIHFDMDSCGLSFCLRHQFETDYDKLYCKQWNQKEEETNHVSMTEPMFLLVKPDGKTLHSFGTDAVKAYNLLEDSGENKQFYFFKKIMVELVNSFREKSETQKTINDKIGKPLPLITILSLALKFLKEVVQKMLESFGHWFGNHVAVVLAVPEIFQVVGAIDFIRRAATEAGFSSKNVSVVTEIDTVSICYQCIPSALTANKHLIPKCTKGQNYMLVNAGRLATNITIHEMVGTGVVKENEVVSTFEGGYSMIFKAFKGFCCKLFGRDVFDKFKSTSKHSWSDFKKEFEISIKGFDQRKTSFVYLRRPTELKTLYEEINGTQLEDSVKTSRLRGRVRFTADKIVLTSELFYEFLTNAIDLVMLHISVALKESNVTDILIFGQLAEIAEFTYALETKFNDVNVIHASAETFVSLKGSAIIGLQLGSIEKIERVQNTPIVAAIDFGTTYSGWAYSLRNDFEADRTKAYTKGWNSGSTQTVKTPTCILIGPDGQTVEAFGYEAEDRYRDLADTEEHVNYYFFRQFKMLLNRKLGEKLDRNIFIEDEMKRSLLALDVFAMSIRYLKDDLIAAVQGGVLGNLRKQDIHWVLTVPAIWTDGSKQFMREAAIKAGIERKRLTIALEPEAASMYCRYLPVEATVDNTGSNISSLKVGTRYMILDAGGGTIDITVHEVDTNNGVKEVHAACGGGWGGTTVDKEFKRLLIDLCTEDVYTQFQINHTDDWLDLWREFEVKKRTITTSLNSYLRMKLPVSLLELFSESKNCELSHKIRESSFADDIALKRDKIVFSPKIATSLFLSSTGKTTSLVKSILAKDMKISAILLVGGFSESPVLQEAVKSISEGINVVIPRDASLSILKGALVFGHFPKVVTERVLKYTYGISSCDILIEENHAEKRCDSNEASGYDQRNKFSKHVEVNQRVKVGEPQVWQTYKLKLETQTQMEIAVYASEEPNPFYTDHDCTFVGKMHIDLAYHDGKSDREVLVALTFSGTEIVIEAKEKSTGIKTSAAVDFLG